MQKLLQNKSITQKIIIAIVFVILFNFTCPCIVQAGDFNFIFQALSWLAVRLTDCIQWIISFCLTGDGSMMMDHARWDGDSENKDNWAFEFALIHLDGYTIEWPKRHLMTPADIFTGKILITNINFFSDYTKIENDISADEQIFSTDSTAESMNKLRTAISKWYTTIRNITVVGLLSVLVYIAIEMVISSASQDKAKYQKMLTDWLVAICLVFLLHYIMAVTVGICEKLTNLMSNEINDEYYMDKGDAFIFTGEDGKDVKYGCEEDGYEPIQGLAEKIRIYTQNKDSSAAMAYAIMYFAITGYTLIFLWTYMKRFVYMAFFTLIAPIVALTYPIDKVKDGSAQAFDGWLKNYIYNALIQPFNLMIYTVFIGLAYDLASSNFIYVIVVLGTIPFADKQLGSWMGMDKASTRKGIAEGLQGILAFKGAQSLFGGNKAASSGTSSSLGSGSSSSSSSGKPSIRTKDNAFLNGNGNSDLPEGNDQNNPEVQQGGSGQIRTKDSNTSGSQPPQSTTITRNTGTPSIKPGVNSNVRKSASKKTKKANTSSMYSNSSYRKTGKRFTKEKANLENFAYRVGYNAKEKGKTMLKNAPRKILGTAGTLVGAGVGAAVFGMFGQSATSGLIAGGALGKNAGNTVAGVGENIAKGTYKVYEDVLQSDERKIMKQFDGNLELKRKAGSKERRQVIAAVAAENGVGIKEAIGLVDMAEEMASLEGIDIDDAISVVNDANRDRLLVDPTERDAFKQEQIQKYGEARGNIYNDAFDALGRFGEHRYENARNRRLENDPRLIQEIQRIKAAKESSRQELMKKNQNMEITRNGKKVNINDLTDDQLF